MFINHSLVHPFTVSACKVLLAFVVESIRVKERSKQRARAPDGERVKRKAGVRESEREPKNHTSLPPSTFSLIRKKSITHPLAIFSASFSTILFELLLSSGRAKKKKKEKKRNTQATASYKFWLGSRNLWAKNETPETPLLRNFSVLRVT